MKKLILCVVFSTGALFGAEPSSSSSSQPNQDMPNFEQIRPRVSLEDLLQHGPIGVSINNGHFHNEPNEKRIIHINRNPEPKAIGLEIGIMGATEFTRQFCGHAGSDAWIALKAFLFPSEEAAFQESVANLKLLQAQNSEKERELGIKAGEANLKIMKEIRKLISTVRKLNAEATIRALTMEEDMELNSANHSLAMLKGLMTASAA